MLLYHDRLVVLSLSLSVASGVGGQTQSESSPVLPSHAGVLLETLEKLFNCWTDTALLADPGLLPANCCCVFTVYMWERLNFNDHPTMSPSHFRTSIADSCEPLSLQRQKESYCVIYATIEQPFQVVELHLFSPFRPLRSFYCPSHQHKAGRSTGGQVSSSLSSSLYRGAEAAWKCLLLMGDQCGTKLGMYGKGQDITSSSPVLNVNHASVQGY